MKKYVKPNPETMQALMTEGFKGPVTMLNHLKYKAVADYSRFPDLAPAKKVSGQEAYKSYMKHATKYITEAGGEVIFMGKAAHFVIGPVTENWDAILIVKYPSIQHFINFVSNEGYLKGTGHRTAALEDSRLLPMEEGSIV